MKSIIVEVLDRLRFTSLLKNRIAVIEFIDEYFETNRREWFVPRWLADFMVKLLDLSKGDLIVDMFAKNGVIASAAYLNNYENILSYYSYTNEIYWIKLLSLLSSNKKEPSLEFAPGWLRGETGFPITKSADGFLLAPPFNIKFDHHIHSPIGREPIREGNAFFIETAFDAVKKNGKVVALIPDGFLLSSQYETARQHLKEFGIIQSIISLSADSFKPFSSVKASIIVIIKKAPSINDKTFFASIDKAPDMVQINSYKSRDIDQIVEKLNAFRRGKEFKPTKNSFTATILDSKNFHFSKYWLELQRGSLNNLHPGFVSLPLKEVLISISRGNAMIADKESGDIPYLSPASIRELRLIKEEITYTSKEKLPKGKIKRIEAGEVVINIIGPHRGKAALVTEEFAGLPINRHVIAVKPNTNLVIPGYLAIVLNSKFVQEQFFDNSSGVVIPSLNLSSFESIYLPIPNLETQAEIQSEYFELLNELAILNARASSIENDLNNKLNKLGKEGGNA